MRNYIAFLLIIITTSVMQAQEQKYDHTSSWSSFIPKLKIDNSFYVTSEFHFRRTNFVDDWEQLVIRPAIHYKTKDTYDFAIGYSYIRNYEFSEYSTPINANEHNIWQQVQLSHTHQKLKFTHRFRVEERFIDKIIQPTENAYEIDGTNNNNRFRYRFTITRPIIKINEDKSISLKAFDEFFISLDDGIRPKSFNQNWFYVGLGYPISSSIGLGIGYHNIGLSGSGDVFITNHILQTTITYAIN